MKRLAALTVRGILVLALLCLGASETLTNRSGKVARGVAITFSESVRISSYDESTFSDQSPSGRADRFTFSGGTLADGGRFKVSWSPSSATVTSLEWVASGAPGAGLTSSLQIPNLRPEYASVIGSAFGRSSSDGVGGSTRIPNLGIQSQALQERYTTFLELLRRNTGNELEALRDPNAIIGPADALHHGWGSEIAIRIGSEPNGTHAWVDQVIGELNAGLGRDYFRRVSSGPARWSFDYSKVDYRNDREISTDVTLLSDGNPKSATFAIAGLYAFEDDFKTQLRRAIVSTLLLFKDYDPDLVPRLGYDQDCFESTAFSLDILHIVDVLSSLESGRDFSADQNVVNRSPVAMLPKAIATKAGVEVQLDGSASLDPDGQIVSYTWRQVFSTKTDLQYRTNVTASLVSSAAPITTFRPTLPGAYCFALTVVDNAGASSEAELQVEVGPATAAFDIEGVSAFAYLDRTGFDTFIPGRLDALAERYRTEWIEFSPYWWMTNKTSSDVHPLGDGGAGSPGFTVRDDDLVALIEMCHSRGLKVFLRPTLEFHNWTEWRGGLQPANWTAWFESYARFMVHYAEIAEQTGVEMLTVGVELKNSNGFTDNWRSVIRQVRAVYHGLLTYSDSELLAGLSLIKFWDALDLIGCSGYTAITGRGSYWDTGIAPTDDPPFSDFVASIDGAFSRYVLPAYQKYGKPVLVCEAGCANYDGANLCPWCWESIANKAQDNNEQVMYFEALLQVLLNKDWVQGVFPFVWTFKADYNWQHEDWPISHELRLGPVAEVIRLWYGGDD